MQSHFYNNLSDFFYEKQLPEKHLNTKVALFDEKLGKELNFFDINVLTGNKIIENTQPIAMAYSGHQFGHYTRLGDGRACLLGEIDVNGVLYDIHLKGSGKTAFSRGGDGRGTLSSMVREYIISHFMQGVNIPTTKSLAVIDLNKRIRYRSKDNGGILARVAKSHIRFGTFEYAYEKGGIEKVKELADYVIKRYYPNSDYYELLEKIGKNVAKMIAKWMSVGFIHGVMNTDNMSIVGETIDYGPCAFMDIYVPNQVFSSIDTYGRYAYNQQPIIGKWNYSILASTLVDLIIENTNYTVDDVKALIEKFDYWYKDEYEMIFSKKIGFNENKIELVNELLKIMEDEKLDFTDTFIKLSNDEFDHEWTKKWKKENPSFDLMKEVNPKIIPRNKVVEEFLEEKDFEKVQDYVNHLINPFDNLDYSKFNKIMTEKEIEAYQTYCGT